MGVWRPDWWYYPEQCEHGHEWVPGRVLVSFTRCDCPPVQAAYGKTGGLGHLTVQCAEPECRWKWYTPPHEPGTGLLAVSVIRYLARANGG